MPPDRKIKFGIRIIKEFTGKYKYLSNFYSSPIHHQGIDYPTAEHLYQALKTRERSMRRKISLLNTPGQAKGMGRRLTLRSDWNKIRITAMRWVIGLKFDQNQELKEKLLATQNSILIEGNYWHDNYWGDCTCSDCKNIMGSNYLGKILMKVRIVCHLNEE